MADFDADFLLTTVFVCLALDIAWKWVGEVLSERPAIVKDLMHEYASY